MGEVDYKKAGVDIKKADQFVRGISSFVTSEGAGGISAFGSLFDLKRVVQKCKNPVLVSSTDGVGTKLKLAQKFNSHKGVGVDLVAMNVNDIICLGAKPLFFLDYIACGKLKIKVLKEVLKGIHQALSESDCSLLGGETAEMPGMYEDDVYDLAGFSVGVVDKNKMITGSNIQAGDRIIGISSSGLHSNGFSLVRKLLDEAELLKYKSTLLKPTRIYVEPIMNLFSFGYQKAIKGIAHITGGAFYNKATKILPKGLALAIDKKSWSPHKIFKVIQAKGKLSDLQMYSVFNMGIGLMLVVEKKAAEQILKKLKQTYKAYIIGEVVQARKKEKCRF